MELLLDLVLVLKNSADPLLEHVGSHGVVKLVLKRFVLEVEFDIVVTVIMLDNVESDTHSPIWDGLSLVRE